MKRGTASRVILGKNTIAEMPGGVFVGTDVILGKKDGLTNDFNGLVLSNTVMLGKKVSHAAIISVIVRGANRIVLPDAIANSLSYVKAFGGTEQRNLPLGYTQFDRIHFDGNCYFDTGVVINSLAATVKLIAAFDSQTSSSPCMMWGYMASNSSLPRWGCGIYQNKWLASANATSLFGTANTDKHIFITELYDNNGTPRWSCYLDGVEPESGSIASSETITGNTLSAYIGARNNNGTAGNYVKGNFTYLEITQDGVCLAKIYPCKRDSDNVLGLYNTVTNEFLPNLGTGTLTADIFASPTPDVPMDIVSNNGVLKYGVLSTNLLDLANCTNGYYYTPAGAYTSAENVRLSNYIPVKAGVAYTMSVTGAQGQSNVRLNLFDTGKNWLSQTVFVSYAGEERTQTITPTQDGFFAFSANYLSSSYVYWNTAQVVQGSYTVETMPEYEPYREGVYADGTVETINVHGKNLYNKADGVLFGYPTANYTWFSRPNAGGELSIMVRLKEGSTYTVTRAAGSAATFRIQASATSTLTAGQSLVNIDSAGTTTIDTKTFTVPVGYPYVLFYVRNTPGQSSLTVDDVINAFQVELGSTATEYAPYFNGGTATTEMLLKVGDYTDMQEILSGAVTRNIGIKVFNGTEDWSRSDARAKLVLTNSAASTTDGWAPYCTHYQGFVGGVSIANMPDNSCKVNVNTQDLLIKDATHNTDLATWKQYLAQQYAAGTPVIVIYPLATPTTESVAGQTLQVTDGDNVLEITQASLDGLELEAQYNTQVQLTVQEVESANLDNDVTVTIL